MKRKKIYNPESKESLNDRRVFGGNSDGMINFTRMKYQWALNLWDTMEANTWFPKEVQMTGDAKDYTKLTIPEKRMYDLVLSQLIFMDSLQANNLMDNINPYITSPEINACLSRQSYEECLLPEMEVMTLNGWKRIDEITMDDLVLQSDINQKSSFVKPLNIVSYDKDEEIYKFENRYISQYVTGEHRMFIRDRGGKNIVKQAKDITIGIDGYISYDFINSTYKEGSINTLTPYQRLLIAIQADGCIFKEKIDEETGKITYKNRNGKLGFITVVVSISKERKIKRLKDILDECSQIGVTYKITEGIEKKGDNVADQTVFRIKIPIELPITKFFDEWIDLKDVTREWCVEFIKELKEWDGWDYGKTTIGYDTVEIRNSDIVQQIGVMSGYRTLHRLDSNVKQEHHRHLHRISFCLDKDYTSRSSVTCVKEHYKGKVYCLTVPDSFFVVRNQGKISVTGNCNHSKSYAVMVESISDNTDSIYDMWKTDSKLREKNTYIAKVYEELSNGELTDEKLLLVLFANQILEGIYFYAGFTAIYSLGKSGKMLGSSQMIRFIQRDEITHLLLFQNMINSVRKERPKLFTASLEQKVREMFRKAVELEASWGAYITQGQILGLTDEIFSQYIQYLADRRLEAVGYKAEYNVKHPIPWVDGYASFNEQRTNFFEGNVVNYSKGSITFDDF